MKWLALLVSTVAYAEGYELPIQTRCGGTWQVSQGAFICHDDGVLGMRMRVKIPPTKGTLRIMNCNRDLTDDGNPDDFDTKIWKEGWFLWRRTVRQFAATPEFELPEDEVRQDDCPVVVSVFGEGAGIQSAIIVRKRNKLLRDFVEFSCAGKAWRTTANPLDAFGTGVSVCKGLSGAEFRLRYRATENSVLNVIGSACKVAAKRDVKQGEAVEIPITLRVGSCPITVSALGLKSEKRAFFLLVGSDRSHAQIDSPSVIFEDDEAKVTKPVLSNFISIEVYDGDKIAWRSGKLSDSVTTVELKQFTKSASICVTAYSQEVSSVSFSCYSVATRTEIPYQFK